MKTKTYTIGLDLGDRKPHACVFDAAGEVHAEEVIVNTREVLTAFCDRYPDATFVMETGTNLTSRFGRAWLERSAKSS